MPPPDVRATDTLANERTFLAYVRTALAFIAFGFVIARFSLFTREIATITHTAEPGAQNATFFGVSMAAAGIIVGIYGAWRYIIENNQLREGKNPTMPNASALIGAIALAVIGGIVAFDLLVLR